jgi:hypothetical protein
MRISAFVDFEVEINDEDLEDDFVLSDEDALAAASQAIFDHLVLSENGVNVVDIVGVHVDGIGWTTVEIAEPL